MRICTICARGGSKGLKGKNIRVVAGKPLVLHTIDQARATGLFDAIAVTSDSEDILRIAGETSGIELVRRPSELASDESPKLPAVRHCVQEVERARGAVYETIVDLDPTSPLRDVSDIRAAVELCEKSDDAIVITAAAARRSPYFNLIELDENGIARLSKPPSRAVVRRQDSPSCYDMNASIYVWRRRSFLANASIFTEKTRLYVMPSERSIDIDSDLDLEIVELLMARKR